MKLRNYFYFNVIVLICFGVTLVFCKTNSDQGKLMYGEPAPFENVKLIRSAEKSTRTLFVITGFGENPDSIVVKYSLFRSLLTGGYDLAFVSIEKDNQTLYARQDEVNKAIRQIGAFIENVKDSGKTFSLLGFSIGGSACLKILSDSLFCKQRKISSCVVIDPPLDLERLFNSLARQSKYSSNDVSKSESQFLLDFFRIRYKYSPATNPDSFWRSSIISLNDTVYYNFRSIRNKNLLIFTNNDTTWQRVHRDRLPGELNISDCIRFYNAIKATNNVRLIVTNSKDPSKNPHSWDNVDLPALINWIR